MDTKTVDQLCAAALRLSGIDLDEVEQGTEDIDADQLLAAGFTYNLTAMMWDLPTGDAAENIPFGTRLTWGLLVDHMARKRRDAWVEGENEFKVTGVTGALV